MTERREHRRCSLTQLLDVTLMRERDIEASAMELSEGGLLCKSSAPVDLLSAVYLMLRIPTAGPDYMLKTEGVVMHQRREGEDWVFGIAFGPLTARDKEALRSYLDTVCA